MSDHTGPLVSLIMPVWRPRREWLREAVASALGQRQCAIELLVIDDGNASPVADVLADVSDARLRVIRIAHRGVSAARNAGMAEAHGAFLRFIDCDDVIDPDSTRRLLALSTDDRTIAYGATEYCDTELRPYKVLTRTLEGSIVAEGLTEFTVLLPSLLFPRGVIERNGAWDETLSICEDWDFVQRALEHGRVRGETSVATHYRRHPTSAVGSASAEIAERSAARVVEQYLIRHPEARDAPWVRRAHAVRLTTAGYRYLEAGARTAALVRFVGAFQFDAPYAAPVVWRILFGAARARLTRLLGRASRVPLVDP